jgi:hypothetical protein
LVRVLEGHAFLTTQVAFQGEAVSGAAQLLHVCVAEIFHADVGAHPGLGENLLGTGETDAIHIGEGDLNPLVARDIDACNPSHVLIASGGQWGSPSALFPGRPETVS